MSDPILDLRLAAQIAAQAQDRGENFAIDKHVRVLGREESVAKAFLSEHEVSKVYRDPNDVTKRVKTLLFHAPARTPDRELQGVIEQNEKRLRRSMRPNHVSSVETRVKSGTKRTLVDSKTVYPVCSSCGVACVSHCAHCGTSLPTERECVQGRKRHYAGKVWHLVCTCVAADGKAPHPTWEASAGYYSQENPPTIPCRDRDVRAVNRVRAAAHANERAHAMLRAALLHQSKAIRSFLRAKTAEVLHAQLVRVHDTIEVTGKPLLALCEASSKTEAVARVALLWKIPVNRLPKAVCRWRTWAIKATCEQWELPTPWKAKRLNTPTFDSVFSQAINTAVDLRLLPATIRKQVRTA